MSREEYLHVARKAAPSFEKVSQGESGAGTDRDLIYDLFLRYESWKAVFRAFDVMDAVLHIYREIQCNGYPGDPIHEVYIDEVQDFTQAELRLFIAVCSDKNALFLTGDTCQTIARGVGFRFEELTTMFKRLQQAQESAAPERSLPEFDRIKVPQFEKLTVNYRTHNGILGCASKIVDIILSLFPNAIDKLEKDRGHFDGPRPQLLTETSTECVH